MLSADRPETRLATRLSFLVAGFGLACWAPLVPFARDRLAVDDGTLGLLLLCLGIGSIAVMLTVGVLSARYGSRPLIVAGGFGLAVMLPFLAVAPTAFTMGLAILLFGVSLGLIDVAMNIHAVEVERASSRPLMSGFHGLFSIGGFTGAGLMTLLLSFGLSPFVSTLVASVLLAATTAIAWPHLLKPASAQDQSHFALPRGIVLLLAVLAAAIFLAEGAILDWSALLITQANLVDVEQGGLGYMAFAVAMTVGRLGGDAVTARIGDGAALFWGGIVAIIGFIVLLFAPVAALAMVGFVLIGLGASNIVPVLFRRAGTQTVMPAGLAVAAISTVGYAGVLAGPALIGFAAQGVGLRAAFWMLTALICLVPLCARFVASGSPAGSRGAGSIRGADR